MFDAAKHPRGFHGHFGVVQRSHDIPYSAPARGPGAATVRLSAAAERARKLAIKQRTEVARGVRPPANFRERMDLEYASPRKIAEARARTGSAMRPRLGPEGSLHVTREAAGGFRSPTTMGTRRTFTGKRVRVRGAGAAHKQTARGRYVQSK
jgi:hypothetical protein